MEEFIVRRYARPKLRNAILIEGLPGVGNVARIVVDLMIRELKAKKFLEIYSKLFPNMVIIDEKFLVNLPKVEFYFWKGKKHLVFVTGDMQPTDDEASYLLAEQIIKVARECGVKEIITLGGIALDYEPIKPNVFGACTDESYKRKLKKYKVIFSKEGAAVIIGAAGLLLGIGKLYGMKGFSLLAEAYGLPGHLAWRSSREILEVLTKYLGIKISTKELDRKIKEVEFKLKTIPKILKKLKAERKPVYIG